METEGAGTSIHCFEKGENNMLQIKNLTKRYGDKLAVDNLSLHIMPGEIYGFIGHNGAGKTTTIKACTGILNFEEGDILIDGVSIKEKPLECKKQMAYIPDNPDMYDFMTGIEEADTAKVVSLVDKECVADNDVATLSSSFELLTSMGVEYSIDYKITSTEKANRATIKHMCEGLYGDTSVASKVRCAYICDVDYTMTINYLGETETEDDKMSLICYKKGGKWYIGGTVENE